MAIRCRVKFVINPNSSKCVTEKYFPSENLVVLKLMVHNANELPEIINSFGKLLDRTYNWEIEWNWKNVPDTLQKNTEITQRIYAIFADKTSNKNMGFCGTMNFGPIGSPNSGPAIRAIPEIVNPVKYEPPHLRVQESNFPLLGSTNNNSSIYGNSRNGGSANTNSSIYGNPSRYNP